MIEKLDKDCGKLQKKINEIIDTIYDIQLAISRLDPDSDWYDGNHIAETSAKNVQDKFAEQRKWIGKLCLFWDGNYENGGYDILDCIEENEKYPYIRKKDYVGYEHCEPVSEDLIYKGE